MNPRWFIKVVVKWLPWAIGTVLVAAATAYFVSTLQPAIYESEATLVVGTSLSGNPGYNELLVSEQLASTYATVVKTRPILVRVIERLQLTESPEDLQRRVQGEAAEDGALMTVRVSDADAARAAALVNALVEELIATSPAGENPLNDIPQSVDEQLAEIRTEIEGTQAAIEPLATAESRTAAQEAELRRLQDRLITLRDTYATLIPFATSNASNLLTVVDPAVPAASSASPRLLLNAMLAAMAAFLIVAATAFTVEYPRSATEVAR